MLSSASSLFPVWLSVSRLGEAQMVLPAALAVSWWVARQADLKALLLRWGVLLGAAVLLTTLTKVAFIGWGVGIASLDFTGISGHAMFAAAAYPLLLRLALSFHTPGWQRAAWIAGFALAAVIAVSRVVIGAHSASEIVAGFLLGGAVGVLALPHWRVRDVAPSLVMPLVLTLWFALHLPFGEAGMPKVDTHGLVTRLSLVLSARDEPFRRIDLHRPNAPSASTASR
jgi:membrane-associated phospholipid phosphatase